jgi:hypothetical protein
MISAETRAQVRQWSFAEHWKIGTIAQALRIHPDTVRRAIESDRFHRVQTLRACVTDPYLPFIRQTLESASTAPSHAHLPHDPRPWLPGQHRPVASCRCHLAPHDPRFSWPSIQAPRAGYHR